MFDFWLQLCAALTRPVGQADQFHGPSTPVPETLGVSHDQVDVLRPSLHGVDEQLGATVEAKHNQLKKATGGVEPQPQLALRTLLIKVGDEDRMFSRMSAVFSGDSMPQRRSVNPHYAASIQAFTAARIASERLTCSRSARAVSWASRASSIRTATISPGPSPTGRRPRFRNRSTGKPFSASSAQAWICSSVTGLPRIVSPTTHKA